MKGWVCAKEETGALCLFCYRARPPGGSIRGVFYGSSTPWLIRHGFRNCGFRVDLEPDLPSGRLEISAWATDPGRNKAAQLAQPRLIDLPIDTPPSG